MELKPKREEYRFEGKETIHEPTGMPIWLPYQHELPSERTVNSWKRDMKGYDEVAVKIMGAQLLIEKGY